MDLYAGFVDDQGVKHVQKNGIPIEPWGYAQDEPCGLSQWTWGENTRPSEETAVRLIADILGVPAARAFGFGFAERVVALWPDRPGWCWSLTAADLFAWCLRDVAGGMPHHPALGR